MRPVDPRTPPKIDLLPEHLIDQIKAGEVIERPGNLIKEILENALDAGATKLELAVRNNGLDLISLKDNGHGMRLEDLPYAFSRHATSKIARFEDLYQLRSFGFRGEALASIAAISKLQCITKTAAGARPAELRIEGGETVFLGERQTAAVDHGTELVIQDLFYNTPARLKFIQGQQAEKTFIRKIVYAFVLARPDVEFQLKVDDGDKDIYPARPTLTDRIRDVFSRGANGLLSSRRNYENFELELFLVPGSVKAPFRIQNIYINDRYILDKQLHRVVTAALASAFGNDDFHYVAYLHLPPETIDVNVHPNKTIIKVLEVSKLIGLLSSTVKELAAKKAPGPAAASAAPGAPAPAASFFDQLGAAPSLQQERHGYNMEGLFSPHNLPAPAATDHLWIGNYFLKKVEGRWLAVSGTKLLEAYTRRRLLMMAGTIPLLVSEPFAARGVGKEALALLAAGGAELEYLGADTLVLRSIPDWMNGFPLKDVVTCLLRGTPFQELVINPADWSSSTWEEMLAFFPLDELAGKKIAVDLADLLRERLR
jgi:DNA mismatch repair protein MutL